MQTFSLTLILLLKIIIVGSAQETSQYFVFKIHKLAIKRIISASENDKTTCKPSITTVSGAVTASSEVLCRNQLIFNEEFNTFNKNVWQHVQDIFGKNVNPQMFYSILSNLYTHMNTTALCLIQKDEFQWYTNSSRNSFVTDGRLYIRPSLTTDEIEDINICYILMPG